MGLKNLMICLNFLIKWINIYKINFMFKINWYAFFKPHVLHRFYKIENISKPKYNKFIKKLREFLYIIF